MRLLRVIPSLDPRAGGPFEAARNADLELIRNGHSVEVVCLDGRSAPFLRDYPARVSALGPARTKYRFSARLVPWLKQNRTRFDAVVVDGLWQYHAFAAWRALAKTNTPYFVFPHGMLDPWFKRNFPLKHLKKWLYWPWGDYRVLRDAAGVLFTCEEELVQSRQSFWLYRCREQVCGLGVAPPHLNDMSAMESFRNRFPQLHGKRVVLFVGRLHPIKGCDLLLEAFAEVVGDNRDLHLLMVGPDQMGWLNVLKAKAHQLGIADCVTWAGMLQGQEKWAAFAAASVFCLPSHHENFGMVVVEALACGKPVLISDKVNIYREIDADDAGFVESDSFAGTLNGLKRWLSLSTMESLEMGERARRCFLDRYTISTATSCLVDVLRRGALDAQADRSAATLGDA